MQHAHNIAYIRLRSLPKPLNPLVFVPRRRIHSKAMLFHTDVETSGRCNLTYAGEMMTVKSRGLGRSLTRRIPDFGVVLQTTSFKGVYCSLGAAHRATFKYILHPYPDQRLRIC